MVTGNAIKNACELLLGAMRKPDGSFRTYDEMVAEKIPLRYDGKWTASMNTNCDLETAQGSPFAVYMYGLLMAEVAVDTQSGKTTVEGYTVIADVGKINNRLAVDGQIYGGVSPPVPRSAPRAMAWTGRNRVLPHPLTVPAAPSQRAEKSGLERLRKNARMQGLRHPFGRGVFMAEPEE